LSAIDSQLKSRRSGTPERSRQALLWWASTSVGLSLVASERTESTFLFHPQFEAALGTGILLVSAVGLLNHYALINVCLRWGSRRAQIRERIEIYCQKGEDLYLRLANDPTILSGDTRRLVTDSWIMPVTDYLRGTLGEGQAKYFLSIVREPEPDDASVQQFGYLKALVRARILIRLERLRKIMAVL
jgi:hypothetical protein